MSESMTKEQFAHLVTAQLASMRAHELNTQVIVQMLPAVAEHDPVLAEKLMDCVTASRELVAYLKTKVEQ